MQNQQIRIRLKAFDHRLIDQSTQEIVEKNHLHGEIVSYGVLVLLTVDKQLEERAKWLDVYKAMGLPVKLADLEMKIEDMAPVYKKAIDVPATDVSPYPITEQILEDAVKALEAL